MTRHRPPTTKPQTFLPPRVVCSPRKLARTTSTLIKFISLCSHYLLLKEKHSKHFLIIIVTNVANSRNSQVLVSFSALIKSGFFFFHLWIVKASIKFALSKIISSVLYRIWFHCYFPKVSQQNKPPFYSKMKTIGAKFWSGMKNNEPRSQFSDARRLI